MTDGKAEYNIQLPSNIDEDDRLYVALYNGITGELKEVRGDSTAGVFEVCEREPLILAAMVWDNSFRPRCGKKTVKYMTSGIIQ